MTKGNAVQLNTNGNKRGVTGVKLKSCSCLPKSGWLRLYKMLCFTELCLFFSPASSDYSQSKCSSKVPFQQEVSVGKHREM